MGTGSGSMEVEIKAPVEDLEPVRERLLEAGATSQGSLEQADTYFAHPVRSFADTDEALRIREAGDEAHLTYKGPKVDETTKTRTEVDLGVEDAEQARQILVSLGFEPAGRVVKQRETFALEGMTLTLDQVEGLGAFVEIETVVEEEAVDEARSRVLGLAEELGLEHQERRSYLELLSEKNEDGGAE